MGKLITIFDDQDVPSRASLGINLAISLAEQSKEKVVFVDLSLSVSESIEHLTGSKPEKNISDLAEIPGDISKALMKGYIPFRSSGVAFIGGVQANELKDLSPEKISDILKMLSDSFAYTIVVAPAISDIVLS